MADFPISKFAGLHFTNNEVSATPVGAAEDCQNTVINKFGLLEPRRGYQANDLGTPPSQWSLDNSLKINNHYQSPDASTDFFIRENNPPAIYNSSTLVAAPMLTGTYQNLYNINKTKPKMVFYGKCNYLLASPTSNQAYGTVYEFVTSNKNKPYLRKAGVPAPSGIQTADVTGTTFAQNSICNYKAIFLYQNQGGAKILSADSPQREHFVNQVGGAKISVTVNWSAKDISADREVGKFLLQIYRSKVEVGVSNTDYKLIKEVVLTEQDLQSGLYKFTDSLLDSSRFGSYLYTNSDVLGAVAAKFQPPSCIDMALFKDSLWFGGVYNDNPTTVITLTGTSGAVSTTNIANTINGKVTCSLLADGLIYYGTSTGYIYTWDGTTQTALTAATGVGGFNNPVFSLTKSNGYIFASAQTNTTSTLYRFISGTLWVPSGYLTSATQRPTQHSLTSIGTNIYVVQQSSTNAGPTYWHQVWSYNAVASTQDGPFTPSQTGTVAINTNCTTAVPRYILDNTTTDTTKVLAIAYLQDNKPTIAYLDSNNTFQIAYQGAIDTSISKIRPFYSSDTNDFFFYVEYNTLPKTNNIWKLYQGVATAVADCTDTSSSVDSGCVWMGDVNGSVGFASIKGSGSGYCKLWVTPSIQPAAAQVIYDGATDTATEFLSAVYYSGAIISFAWTGAATLMRSYANAGLQLNDSIKIGGVPYTAGVTETTSTFTIDTTSGSSAVRIAATAKSLINVINKYNTNCSAAYISDSTSAVGLILITGKNGTGASGIYSNKISVLSPDCTKANPAGTISSLQTNILRWSANQEPGAAPLANEKIVGAPEDPIIRLVATKDTLFIIKKNSVWVVRNGPNGDVQLLDNTFSCLSADSVCVLNNQVYFLSNKGIVVCSDTGVEVQGQQISGMLDKGNAIFSDAYGFAVEKYNSYYLCMRDPYDYNLRKVFVYSAINQTLVKFKFDCEISSGSVVQSADEDNGLSQKIVLHPYTYETGTSIKYKTELKERFSSTSDFWQLDFFDNKFEYIPTGYSAGSYQITGAEIHTTPKIGDLVTRSPNIRSGVISAAGSSSFQVAWDAGASDDGVYSGQTYTFIRPVQAYYKFAPIYLGAPQLKKNFQEFELSWQSQPSNITTVTFNSDINTSAQLASVTIPGSASQLENQREKSFSRVPRNAARANALSMKIAIATTCSWSLANVNISADGGTNK